MNKYIKKIIIVTIVISVILIVVINIVNSINIPGGIVVAHNSDWIPFYGSFVGAIICGIVGGLITLEGVKATIVYNQECRREDELKKIRPYFLIKINGLYGSKNRIIQNVENQGINRGDAKETYFDITFKNIGMYSAINFTTNDIFVSNAIEQGQESERITIISQFYDGQESINTIKIPIYFQDLEGNMYKQEYTISFIGQIEFEKLKTYNTYPELIEEKK